MDEVVKYMRLPFQFEADRLQQESGSLNSKWIAHFNAAHYEGEWSALPLRSVGGSMTHVVPATDASQVFMDTELMAQCPYIKSIMELLPGEKKAIRLLKLEPGAVIKEHRDHDLCYEQGEARIHIPVTTNPQVEFYLEGERIIMKEGECWYLNFNLPHRIVNGGTADRVHLVIDCLVNDDMKALFEQGEPGRMVKTKVKAPFTYEEQLMIIEALDKIGTPVARELAAKKKANISPY